MTTVFDTVMPFSSHVLICPHFYEKSGFNDRLNTGENIYFTNLTIVLEVVMIGQVVNTCMNGAKAATSLFEQGKDSFLAFMNGGTAVAESVNKGSTAVAESVTKASTWLFALTAARFGYDVGKDIYGAYASMNDDELLLKLRMDDCGGLSKMTSAVEGCYRKYVLAAVHRLKDSSIKMYSDRALECFAKRPQYSCPWYGKDVFEEKRDH